MDLLPGDAVAFATDGIEADYSASLAPGVPAQRLAERIYERHAKGTDDALAVVVRYFGGDSGSDPLDLERQAHRARSTASDPCRA